MNQEQIPSNVRAYLYEISERLKTGHASVMIGAGFSKNALTKDNKKTGPPNWNELGDIFYEKLHGVKPSAEKRYLNPLKLADEVQAAFGRSVLDQLLKKHIRDEDYEPSALHLNMLELPWTDVFTTNFDTLLERSCAEVISRRYDVVINQEDIIYSNPPRIIKLHGSFPSERPLIISEEDYRTYPKKFAPFVNTVQQSLLENTLCLIGFSGEDPNFLQWIGWINDNIGRENSPKIYLIGVLSLSDAQHKLLASKNIVPVDISFAGGEDKDRKIAIDAFLAFLKVQLKVNNHLDWPRQENLWSDHADNVDSVIKKWKALRSQYPNWLILPADQRSRLWDATQNRAQNDSILEDIGSFTDIDYIFELNWRMEKCLFPIYNHMALQYQRILDRYNPFPDKIDNVCEFSYSKENAGLWMELRIKWLTLSLSLLRFYREEDKQDFWMKTRNELSLLTDYLSSDQVAWFNYEQLQKAIFDYDLKEIQLKIDQWPVNHSLPYWEGKRAAVLSEIGQTDEAEKILEFSLLTIRKNLNLSPIEFDYNLVSQEAYLMFLLSIVHRNNEISRGNFMPDQNEVFSERWAILQSYKCDPWEEQKYFDLIFKQAVKRYSPKHTNEDFELNRQSTTYNLGGGDEGIFEAYTFLRYLEEVGIPISLHHYNLPDKTISIVLERLVNHSPIWVLAVLKRCRSEKVVEQALKRELIAKLPVAEIDRYIDNCISTFYNLLTTRWRTNSMARSFIEKLPLIFSRLSTKCSHTFHLKIFGFLDTVYQQEIVLQGCAKLFRTCVDSCDADSLAQASIMFLSVKVRDNKAGTTQINFPEPFNFMIKERLGNIGQIREEEITKLLNLVRQNAAFRQDASTRLYVLYANRILDEDTSREFFNALWLHTDKETGFPVNSGFYKFFYLDKPCPENVNPKVIFKSYILNSKFHTHFGSENIRVMGKGNTDIYSIELLNGSHGLFWKGITWNRKELGIILDKCISWIQADGKYITEQKFKESAFGGNIAEDFHDKFAMLVQIISKVFAYQKKLFGNKELANIKALIVLLENSQVAVLSAKIMFGEQMYIKQDDYFSELKKALLSMDEHRQHDAFESIELACFQNQFKSMVFSTQLLDILSQPIHWLVPQICDRCFQVYDNLLKKDYINIKEIHESIFDAMDKIMDFTKITNYKFEEYKFSAQQALVLRKTVMRFSLRLKRKIELEGLPMPEVLDDWQECANSDDEFLDVKPRVGED